MFDLKFWYVICNALAETWTNWLFFLSSTCGRPTNRANYKVRRKTVSWPKNLFGRNVSVWKSLWLATPNRLGILSWNRQISCTDFFLSFPCYSTCALHSTSYLFVFRFLFHVRCYVICLFAVFLPRAQQFFQVSLRAHPVPPFCLSQPKWANATQQYNTHRI